MQLINLAFLGLATTSLATVLPRAQDEAWAVTYTQSSYANGYRSTTVNAKFTSKAYPYGINSTCSDVYNPASSPQETSSCNNDFSYEYDGTTITLHEVIKKKTLSGSAPLTLTTDGVGRTYTGSATVAVSKK